MIYEEKIAAVNKYIEAFDKQDLNLIREIYADNAVVEDPVGSDKIFKGIDDICAFYKASFEVGAKLSLNEQPRCSGNTVAFAFSVQVGKMCIQPIDVFEFDEHGKVISMKAYWGPENITQ